MEKIARSENPKTPAQWSVQRLAENQQRHQPNHTVPRGVNHVAKEVAQLLEEALRTPTRKRAKARSRKRN